MSRERGLARAKRIRKMHADGVSGAEIARRLGVNQTVVYEVIKNDRFPETTPKIGRVSEAITDLTPPRRRVYDFLVSYLRDRRISPTIREIGESLHCSMNYVHIVMMYLYRNGLVERVNDRGRARCWVPTARDFCPCCRRPMDPVPVVEEVPCGAS